MANIQVSIDIPQPPEVVWADIEQLETHVDWMADAGQSLRKAMTSGESLIVPRMPASQAGESSASYLIVIPIDNHKEVRAVAGFVVQAPTPQALLASQARLEATALLLDHYELRLTLSGRHARLERLGQVLEVLSVVNPSKRFLSAAMALCNQMATQMACNRVSLGFIHGCDVRVQAMSHTDRFGREMKLVQAIEADP